MEQVLLMLSIAWPVIKIVLYIIGIVFFLVFTIYWFELDTRFLKAFEPIFRKWSAK